MKIRPFHKKFHLHIACLAITAIIILSAYVTFGILSPPNLPENYQNNYIPDSVLLNVFFYENPDSQYITEKNPYKFPQDLKNEVNTTVLPEDQSNVP
jgi:hypothetical protein